MRTLLAIVALVVAGSASAADGDLSRLFQFGRQTPLATYEGDFAAAPSPHFRTRLPGGRMGAGSHSERGAPVVYGDLVLLGSAASNALHALSRRDGSIVRSYPASAPVQSAPVVSGEQVIFADKGGSTWCYQLDGTLLWRHTGVAPVLSTPVVDDEHVFVANVEDLIIALHRQTGELDWRYQRAQDLTRTDALALFASPPPAVNDGIVYTGFSDGSLVAIEAVSGDPLWEVKVGEGDYPDIVAGIVTAASDIYASGYFAPFVAIDRSNETVRWRVNAGSAATPLLDSSLPAPVVYHPGSDGHLRAVVARTGEVLWDYNSGKTGALTEVVVTPAGLLFGVTDGGVYLVDPESGEERWRYRGPQRLNGVSAAPVVAGRQVLFVSNAGALYSMLAPLAVERVSRRPWDSQL